MSYLESVNGLTANVKVTSGQYRPNIQQGTKSKTTLVEIEVPVGNSELSDIVGILSKVNEHFVGFKTIWFNTDAGILTVELSSVEISEMTAEEIGEYKKQKAAEEAVYAERWIQLEQVRINSYKSLLNEE